VTSASTHSVPPAGRKPRRLGLYIPWGVALVLAIGWSLAWVWMIGETGRRLDTAAAGLRAAGWQVSWTSRQLGGYPFRLDVNLNGLALKDPSGWAVSLPRVESEAYVFAPTHWIFAAPDGLAFTRKDGGAVTVTARLLRASVSGWDQAPPKLALEGDDVTFTPSPGGKPFWLSRARLLQFETRPGPDGQGAVYFGVEDGAAGPSGWLGRAAQGKPVKLVTETTFTHASDLTGPNLRAAVTRWAHAGGALNIEQVSLNAGDASLASRQGTLSVADNGELAGAMTVQSPDPLRFFNSAPKPVPAGAKPGLTINLHLGRVTIISAPGSAPTTWKPAGAITLNLGKKLRATASALPTNIGAQPLDLSFHDGGTWLGPIRLGKAPRVF
jgi:hypothetical protein